MLHSKSLDGVIITIAGTYVQPLFIYTLPDNFDGKNFQKWKKANQTLIEETKSFLLAILEAKAFIDASKSCTYNPDATSSKFNATGIDYKCFHRRASNGKGWVLIAPDEPGNNWYTENFFVMQYMSKNFNA